MIFHKKFTCFYLKNLLRKHETFKLWNDAIYYGPFLCKRKSEKFEKQQKYNALIKQKTKQNKKTLFENSQPVSLPRPKSRIP